VFPGGNFDKKQDASLGITAIRETFEESGLLLTSSSSNSGKVVPEHVLDEARRNIHEQRLLFNTFLNEHELIADTALLLPFTQWITPANVLRYATVTM
jgi:8-oxo-dGTP pyrophosphatase MutT (NUDIX family)